MSRPSLLVVTRWFPHARDPRDGIFVRDQALLAARDWNVSVLHLTDPRNVGPGASTVERSETTNELPTCRIPARSLGPGVSLLDQARLLRRAGTGTAADLVHAHVYDAAAVAAVAFPSLPLILTEHFSGLLSGVSTKERMRLRLAVRRAAALTAVSDVLAARLLELLPSGKEVRVIPNTIEGSWFDVEGEPLSQRQPRLLGVGNLNRVKRFDRLIAALRHVRTHVPTATLTILGEGAERGRLEGLSSTFPYGVVRMPGRPSRSAIQDHLEHAAMLVVPSDHETFSMVTAESLAAGVPVVATRCGGPEELVSAATGSLVERSEIALAAGVLDTWQRRHSWDRSVLRASVDHLRAEHVAPVWRSLYAEVAATRQ